MKPCPACGNNRLHKQKRAECPYTLAGVSNIILHDVTVVTCARCRRSEPAVHEVDGLTLAVAMAIVSKGNVSCHQRSDFCESISDCRVSIWPCISASHPSPSHAGNMVERRWALRVIDCCA